MSKVGIADRRVFARFLELSSVFSTVLSALLLFIDIPADAKFYGFGIFVAALIIMYFAVWTWSNSLKNVNVHIEGSAVSIKTGDIFHEPGLKVIAFNEYFDTQVDNQLISDRSLNGIFIQKHLDVKVPELDDLMEKYQFGDGEIVGENLDRRAGKRRRFRLGTIFSYKEWLLVAFSKFDESNRATLTMPEYLEFLINFWDSVNRVYAQRSVATTIFGSGITRIKGHKNISDEDLLKIMLWTFRISEMRFKYPAKLTIMIHEQKADQINLFDVMSVKNGV